MDSSPDGSTGATKRRILLTFYAVRFPNPTREPSARQLPTDHDHAVSTREYQSDQSSRMLLGCHRPCCPEEPKGNETYGFFPLWNPHSSLHAAPSSPAGTGSRQAARRNRGGYQKRCSTSRVRFAAPDCGAPLTSPRRSGEMVIATGGSGGNTRRPLSKEKGRKPNPSNHERLD